jgi:anthranilate synthase component 2
MNRILIINNYDSFVFNIFHLLKRNTDYGIDMALNDHVDFPSLKNYSHIILSPGPGLPDEAGSLISVIEHCKTTHSILGVCLGHQAIASCLGAKLIQLSHPLHGHKSKLIVKTAGDPLLGNLYRDRKEPEIYVGLYNSWVVDPGTLPAELSAGSVNETGIIMSLFHNSLNLYGLQFHPESIISELGDKIITNWLSK